MISKTTREVNENSFRREFSLIQIQVRGLFVERPILEASGDRDSILKKEDYIHDFFLQICSRLAIL